MKRIKQALFNKRGMTLTEVMVGVAMIALVSMMMVSGFLAASALIRRGVDMGRSGDIAASYVELKGAQVEPDPTLGGNISISRKSDSEEAPGDFIKELDGSFYRYASDDGESTEGARQTVEYIVFVPKTDGAK